MAEKPNSMTNFLTLFVGVATSMIIAIVVDKTLVESYALAPLWLTVVSLILNTSLQLNLSLKRKLISLRRFFINTIAMSAILYGLVIMAPTYAGLASFFTWALSTLIIIILVLDSVKMSMNGGLILLGVCISAYSFFFGFGGVRFNIGAAMFLWSVPITILLPMSIREKTES